MFSKKKNIMESFNASYAKAVADTDGGSRLLQLTALEKKVKQKLAEPDSTAFSNQKLATIIVSAAGIGCALAGFGVIDDPAIGLAKEMAILTIAGGGLGFVSEAFLAIGFGDTLYEKSKARNQLKYVTTVVPYLPQLKALELRIGEDIKLQTSPDQAHDLLQSKKLKDVLRAYPKLAGVFKEAQLKKPLPALPAPQEPKSQKNNLQL